jgi:hypothetical protein
MDSKQQQITLSSVLDIVSRYLVALDEHRACDYYRLRKRLREITVQREQKKRATDKACA